MSESLVEAARRRIAQAREDGGALREALVRGHGCCMVNDPEFDNALWTQALREQEELALLQRRRGQRFYLYDQWGIRMAQCPNREPHGHHGWVGGNEDLRCIGVRR